MGIDIYMHWDNMTQDEIEAQEGSWGNIERGLKGYLRVPDWPTTEHQTKLLEDFFGSIFFEQYQDYHQYFFDNWEGKLAKLLPDFMDAVQELIKKAISSKSTDEMEVWEHNIRWVKSLFDFLRFGKELQDAKRRPTILISA